MKTIVRFEIVYLMKERFKNKKLNFLYWSISIIYY